MTAKIKIITVTTNLITTIVKLITAAITSTTSKN